MLLKLNECHLTFKGKLLRKESRVSLKRKKKNIYMYIYCAKKESG